MSALSDALRQLKFPPELRIRDSAIPLPLLSADDLRRLIRGDGEQPDAAAGKVAPSDDLDPRFVRKLATAAWRLEREMEKLDDAGPGTWVKERMRILANVLLTEDVEMIDYTGKPYDPQEIWDEVVGSPTEKRNPMIISMREPRILYRRAVIARGTPIVDDVDPP